MSNDIGDDIELRASFTTPQGVPVSPSTVTFRIRLPSGTEQNVTATQTGTGTGVYVGTYLAVEAGQHWWRATATGSVRAVEESGFGVEAGRVVG